MNRHQQRNEHIYSSFLDYLGTAPLMDIYARLAIEFWLSEERIRAIVAQMRKAKMAQQ